MSNKFQEIFEEYCTEQLDGGEEYFRRVGAGVGDGPTSLKFYWYDLPPEYHKELLYYWNLKSRNHRYYCDPGCKICDDGGWGSRGADIVIRQNGGGINLLAKLSLFPVATTPEEADYFVVPALNHMIYNAGWSWLIGVNVTKQLRLFDYLHHYSPETAHKHIFITGDEPSTHPVIKVQPLVVHMGPRISTPFRPYGKPDVECFPGRPWHIVIPDPQITPFTQPREYVFNENRENFIFYFGAELQHIPVRKRMIDEVLQYKILSKEELIAQNVTDSDRRRYNISIHRINKVTKRGKPLTRHLALQYKKKHLKPNEVRRHFNNSKYCPVLSGDIPHQTRFFEAIHHGCLPVVILYAKGTLNESWWRDPLNISAGSDFEYTDKNMPGTINDAYPFADEIPYKDFVVEIPYETFDTEGIMPTLTAITEEEYQRRVRSLLLHRTKLVYDFDSSSVDVFGMFLRQLLRIKDEAKKESGTVFGMKGLVGCGVEGSDIERVLAEAMQNRSFKFVEKVPTSDTTTASRNTPVSITGTSSLQIPDETVMFQLLIFGILCILVLSYFRSRHDNNKRGRR